LDVTAWLEWFLGCLDRALDRADHALLGVLARAYFWNRAQAGPINKRQRAVLNRLLDGFVRALTTVEYAKLATCSPETALRDLDALVERSILVREGKGRATNYQLITPDQPPA
jgi:Fic family protein